ncbi:MAG: precorrin-6y C5,15-methyltransferase (decarboxylating) subunit CbiE [Pseudobacteriovorax sp.]|nr:precorrin-6y C5,15-methyltransferase (decarboxylating) subunit CbiE [Pseudobacteriovorax sp.]
MKHKISIIGMTESGCIDLPARSFNRIQEASLIFGSASSLGFFAEQNLNLKPFPKPLSDLKSLIDAIDEPSSIVILASGDPLCYGIGSWLHTLLQDYDCQIIPNLSSIQLAAAKTGTPWQNALLLSLHGRSIQGFMTKVQRHSLVFCLTDNVNTPQAIADYMESYQDTSWEITLCENLSGPEEKISSHDCSSLRQLAHCHRQNLLILQRQGPLPKRQAILSEEAYAKRLPKKGLITKREIRAISFMNLNIQPEDRVWDIGAGSGAVSIEAAHLAYNGSVTAVECHEESLQHLEDNCRTHKADNVLVLAGEAPYVLQDQPSVDKIFIGGSRGKLEAILDLCLKKIHKDGIIVVNTVTLENTNEVVTYLNTRGIPFESQLIQISRGKDLAGKFHRYDALNPIHCFTIKKDISHHE